MLWRNQYLWRYLEKWPLSVRTQSGNVSLRRKQAKHCFLWKSMQTWTLFLMWLSWAIFICKMLACWVLKAWLVSFFSGIDMIICCYIFAGINFIYLNLRNFSTFMKSKNIGATYAMISTYRAQVFFSLTKLIFRFKCITLPAIMCTYMYRVLHPFHI